MNPFCHPGRLGNLTVSGADPDLVAVGKALVEEAR